MNASLAERAASASDPPNLHTPCFEPGKMVNSDLLPPICHLIAAKRLSSYSASSDPTTKIAGGRFVKSGWNNGEISGI